jgi:nucleoside-diphosphate-sugar epimerase
MILVTGASGLIGRHLCARLESEGLAVRRFDICADPKQDIKDVTALDEAMKDVTGVVHLAAVSRVAWAQNDPELCLATNVAPLRPMTEYAVRGAKQWFVFASSREVYGNPVRLPVREDDPLEPVNEYGRSKRDAELIVNAARMQGLIANICRFSNVYGCVWDHPDRVAMAFSAVAARGGTMHVEGGKNTFDFTHVADVIDGLYKVIVCSMAGRVLPAIHLSSGTGTTLRELAELAATHASFPVEIIEAHPRTFDVSAFVGDTSLAFDILGWRTSTQLGDGIARLIGAMAASATSACNALTN